MAQHPRRDFLNTVFHSGLAVALSRFALFTPMATLTHGIQAFGSVPKKLPDNKSIFELRGTVLVNGEKAHEDTFIKANALIETKSNSYIIFKVGKDAHILRENSKMQLQGSNVVESGLNLLTGKILSVFGERSQRNQHTLRTSTATIGVRGTGIYAESHEDSSYLCTCYGSTIIEANEDLGKKDKQFEEIESSHHDAPRFILKNPENNQLIVPAPMFNHTDEELVLIEAIVGRESPISAIQNYSSPRRGY